MKKPKYKFALRTLVTIHMNRKQKEDNGLDRNMNTGGARFVDGRSRTDGEASYLISGYWFPEKFLKEFPIL